MDTKIMDFRVYFWAIMVSIFFSSCGGGPTPEYLKELRVDISIRTPKKEIVLKKDEAIFNPKLSYVSILNNSLGKPSYVIGSGLWGKPSAAVYDIDGTLLWKKEYGYDAMGKPAVLDDGEKRFVVLEKKKDLLFLDFETGEIVRKGPPNRILASADFTGDGHHEILVGLAETDFAILDGKQQILHKISLSIDYWYEPVVTASVLPFVVISAADVLDVYDSKLKHVKKFDAQGAVSPMHVVAARFIGEGPDALFIALYHGRGGWNRNILYVFSSTGELVYKEILESRYRSIHSVPERDGMAFTLSARNEALLYSF